jgi:anti-sigma factor RsiW
MNCDCYSELWSKYCEGEIDQRSKENFEEHLRSCRICAEGLAAFKRTLEELRELPRLDVSPVFDARLARALAEERLSEHNPWYSKLGRLGVRVAPAAASIAAVLIVSIVLALQFAPGGGDGQVAEIQSGRTAAGPVVANPMPVSSSAGLAQVRVEPWSIAGQWPQSLADSSMSNYKPRFVLDKIILEGEEAARASVPEEEKDVQKEYVTF